MKIHQSGNTLIISNLKELTAANATDVQKSVQKLLSPEIKCLHLEASDMGLMDSTGLGIMIILHKRLSQNGGVTKISNPSIIVEQLLKMTRLNQVFQIEKA